MWWIVVWDFDFVFSVPRSFSVSWQLDPCLVPVWSRLDAGIVSTWCDSGIKFTNLVPIQSGLSAVS